MDANNDQWLKDRCNRYKNGQCERFPCFERGGYPLAGYAPEIATCEAHEILTELEHLRKIKEHWKTGAIFP